MEGSRSVPLTNGSGSGRPDSTIVSDIYSHCQHFHRYHHLGHKVKTAINLATLDLTLHYKCNCTLGAEIIK